MIKAIKGTRDILPPESALWSRVENTAREILALYGFAEIRTPVFESTELFARGVGEDTDIVSKEMYTFEDRDEQSLTLRPEGTAPAVRAYIEHQLQQESSIAKLYYLGPMFRRERPQKGRYRQFHQIGAEVLGSDNPAIEAEVLEMLQFFLKQIGIEDQTLLVNSIGCPVCRPRFLEELKRALAEKKVQLCLDCQRRSETNPLRVLDCKVESCQPVIDSLPKISEFLDEACRAHFDKFLGYLTSRQIPFTVVPRLVRGLDYYTRTTFEITSGVLGAQNTLIGGGRYDGLAEALGGPPTKGFGFALGLERILLVLQQSEKQVAAGPAQLFLAPLGEAAFEKATLLARDLRQQGIRCLLDFEARSLKSAMRLANKLQAQYVLILGETELQTGRYLLKRMTDGTQREVREVEIPAALRGVAVPVSQG
ncbi:MAG: histidine--tRNA ligase [Acidobacteria bacterium]|nr:histidine--tRNA ligase [Acidobacteriota bacterium]MCI0627316.1 histidine--tRNA ligase [Acidobacteriota bacterium]MCI0721253.1 histidine--tRNA ligase [Acidobacteriota bacterium]